MSNTGILRRKSMQISVLLSVLLAVVLLVGVSPAALASGPLFHTRPDYMPLAEGPEDLTVTVEDLADANSYEALLRKYGGFAVETTLTPESDGEGRYSFFYGTDSYNFFGYAPVPGHQNVLAELVTKTDVYSLNQNADGVLFQRVDLGLRGLHPLLHCLSDLRAPTLPPQAGREICFNLHHPAHGLPVCHDRSFHLHRPAQRHSREEPRTVCPDLGWQLRLLLHPGLGGLRIHLRQRPHVSDTEEAQIEPGAGWLSPPFRIHITVM